MFKKYIARLKLMHILFALKVNLNEELLISLHNSILENPKLKSADIIKFLKLAKMVDCLEFVLTYGFELNARDNIIVKKNLYDDSHIIAAKYLINFLWAYCKMKRRRSFSFVDDEIYYKLHLIAFDKKFDKLAKLIMYGISYELMAIDIPSFTKIMFKYRLNKLLHYNENAF